MDNRTLEKHIKFSTSYKLTSNSEMNYEADSSVDNIRGKIGGERYDFVDSNM